VARWLKIAIYPVGHGWEAVQILTSPDSPHFDEEIASSVQQMAFTGSAATGGDGFRLAIRNPDQANYMEDISPHFLFLGRCSS
jgi:hypothetical protein